MKKPCNRSNLSRAAALCIIMLAALLLPSTLFAQAQTSPTDGMKENTPAVHAFTNTTIVTAPGRVLNNATLVIRNGVVEAVGRNARVPADARVWDMQGKTLYPGFIDAHSNVGMNDPRVDLDRGSQSWNPQLRAHLTAEGEYNKENDGSGALRSQGFTTALSVPPLGLFRGQAAVMSLGNGEVADRVIKPGVAQSMQLTRSQQFGFTYPTSPIGAIALIRQTFYDAEWHEKAHSAYNSNPSGLQRPEWNAMLASLRDAVNGEQPLLFETSSDEEILRALRFTEEFNITPWLRGNGHEYKLLDVLSERSVPLILPLEFPGTPDIQTPEDALNEDLADLRHWYLAPENPARVAGAGITFSLTADGLDNKSHFLRNLRKAVELGLSKETALAALTVNPANLFGISSTHGTLETGKKANIVVADGDIFENGSQILDVWVEGSRFVVNREDAVDPRGGWQIVSTDGSIDGDLTVRETRPGRLGGSITIGENEIDLTSASVHDESRRFRADFSGSDLGMSGPVRITASVTADQLIGWAEIPGQDRIQWRADRTAPAEDRSERERRPTVRDVELADLRPAMEFGRESIPSQPQNILVRNATVWTMGPDGILENADLLVTRGQVAEVGQNLRAPRNTVVIDAEGKHVTPGLIDAHLHSGVNGVNEIGNAIVPEVRMGDVLNINNIWMYRQLAGGLTTAHVMHGSANPIGGQNVHIKMRWGALSDDLKIDGAPRTVKFALGENPKRVGSDRYPETRMGVEQIIADRFRMARDYEARWKAWEENPRGIPPRRDIRLDAIVDILNEDILVQSHSYRQDEILMLMRLAEDFDFTIKAFHHGVEAFKVAPELADHGAGAVVWSDWGGFKIEAYDNTNYNARLLHEAGVVTSLHSDNSQIASRMNWEAAKMVRVGVDPETGHVDDHQPDSRTAWNR
jgi:imidazolonepropionase-like amidohydrolase